MFLCLLANLFRMWLDIFFIVMVEESVLVDSKVCLMLLAAHAIHNAYEIVHLIVRPLNRTQAFFQNRHLQGWV
jgi:hypothetical protein